MGAGGSSAARWSEEITAASPDQLLRFLDGRTGEEREKLSATWNSKLSVFSTSLDFAFAGLEKKEPPSMPTQINVHDHGAANAQSGDGLVDRIGKRAQVAQVERNFEDVIARAKQSNVHPFQVFFSHL